MISEEALVKELVANDSEREWFKFEESGHSVVKLGVVVFGKERKDL